MNTFEKEFLRLNPERRQVLAYIRASLHVSSVKWADMTKVNLCTIADYIKSQVSPNSAFTYLSIIKSFLNRYSEEGLIPCKSWNKELSARRAPSQHIALTIDEIIKFDEYEPKTKTEYDVKILFMRGCLTGMRLSDAMMLTEDNIRDGVLFYVSQKTMTEVQQPVHNRLMKYVKNQPKKQHLRPVVNRTIQNICKSIGMTEEVQLYVNGKLCKGEKYKFITMHSSRRSYVTCLAANGVPVATISKLAGHSSTGMTYRYVCLNTKSPGREAMEFFNK